MARQCSAIKANGERCKALAASGKQWCIFHDPANAEQRSRAASRGGKSKPSKEVAELKAELRTLKDDVLAGRVDRNDATVAVQIMRVLKDLIELDRRVRETDELAAEIAELKREYGAA